MYLLKGMMNYHHELPFHFIPVITRKSFSKNRTRTKRIIKGEFSIKSIYIINEIFSTKFVRTVGHSEVSLCSPLSFSSKC